MKVLMINSVCGIRSTGRICTDLAKALEEQGHQVKIAYGRAKVPQQYVKYAVPIGTKKDMLLHVIKARLFDASGFCSKNATIKFINWVKEYDPDVIHLHNIHGYYIHIGVLFDYLRASGKKIIWTLHDAWSFTGHSTNCEGAGCWRWQDGCYSCPNKKRYPKAYIDRSKVNWLYKKDLFQGVPNLTIITPSQWLADWVKQSFLKEYPVKVINNGIDTTAFYPVESNFKQKCGIVDKKVILGVASVWSKNKGFNDFIQLSQNLDQDNKIVLIGLTKQQIKKLPKNVIGITRTNNVRELAEIYTAADVFVNPTYDDNYPTVNLEAIACHTPVITYNTGGSPESVKKYNGTVVEKGNIQLLKEAINNLQANVNPITVGQRTEIDVKYATKKYLAEYYS